MRYKKTYALLREAFDQSSDRIELPGGTVITNYTFQSASWRILPGNPTYRCDSHDRCFVGRAFPRNGDELDVADADVIENRRFRYSVFYPSSTQRPGRAILLFHGLNERGWDKYLPWAERLVERTNSAVILFPLAFHMNRAPAAWGDPRLMLPLSQKRRTKSPTLANSTFANVAISTRLEATPQRLVWSGLQTFYDVVQLVDEIRDGRHPLFAADASVDFFGYSIGAFLCEILLMTDPGERFADTRLFIFCGGPTLDRLYPNSRYILDSDATIALYSFYLARFENELRADERLAHYMREGHHEGRYFEAMLNYRQHKDVRERRLNELADHIAALALRHDDVVPASEVLNTLQGDFRNIPIPVRIADFPFDHSHVTPFPPSAPDDALDRCFDDVFDTAAEHFTATLRR